MYSTLHSTTAIHWTPLAVRSFLIVILFDATYSDRLAASVYACVLVCVCVRVNERDSVIGTAA